MEKSRPAFGLKLKSKKNNSNEKSKLTSVTTPVSKKSTSLYKEVLKESTGKSGFKSPFRQRNRGSLKEDKRDEYDFHCSFDSDEENMSDVSLPVSQGVTEKLVLQGVVAYVEVRTNTENRFEGICKQMELLGAVVVKKFIPEVTHVVYKDGKKSTRDKAIKKGIHLVNVLWVESCKQSEKRVSEELFPVMDNEEMHTPVIPGRIKRTKSMQPRSFEEDLKNSAERVNRRKRRIKADEKMSPLTTKTLFYKESPFSQTTTSPHQSPFPGPCLETPTIPWTAPLDSLQTDSGLRKKRKRNLSSKGKSPNNSDDNVEDKTTRKKAKTNSEQASRTNSEDEVNVKASSSSKGTDAFAFSGQEERDCLSDSRGKLKRDSARNNGSDNSCKNAGKLGSSLNDVFTFYDEEDLTSSLMSRCKARKNSLKGLNMEEKTNSILKELDIFTFNEEDPEIKTTRMKKTSKSKSLGSGKELHSTQKDAEDEKTKFQANLSRQPILKDEMGLNKEHNQRVNSNILSDSGIYLSEVEVNNTPITNPTKKQRLKKSQKTNSTNVTSKEQTELDSKTDNDQQPNSKNHSKRTEQPQSKIIKKVVKKNANRNYESNKATPSSRKDNKGEKADMSEPSPSKKNERETANRKNRKRSIKNRDENGSTGSEAKDNEQPLCVDGNTSDSEKSKKETRKKIQTRISTDEEEDKFATTSSDCEDNGDIRDNDSDHDDNGSTSSEPEAVTNKIQSRKRVVRTKKPSRSLVLTSMHFCDQDVVMSVIRKLGGFYITDKVSQDTTHVINGTTKRTLNVLTAIAQGCWLVSPEWAMKSLEAGYWIDEEPYELSDSFPSAQLSRLERANTGPDYRQELFTDVEPIYVCENTSPPTDSLVNLITLCGGKVCTSIRNASVCVGNINRKVNAVKVSETWVIDSITEHTALPYTSYIL